MKYISYLIFVIFIAVLLYFLNNALEPKSEVLHITGSAKCGECHQLKNIGDQQSLWKSSKHSEAYQTLLSTEATNFAKSNNIEEPVKNRLCLKCHTTEFHFEGTPKTSGYDINEGVGCESCHGAGSKYSPAWIMKDENLFKSSGGIKGDESSCKPCHSLKGNKEKKISENICPFQTEDFDYRTEFQKIIHPLNKDK
ncbi:MAG: cytochrome c family protein [Ignavibacteria bacterium]|nr:cytochrome c family protein [Ignavibacteria bacterium]